MRVLAYYHGPARIRRHAEAFAAGCAAHGVACGLRQVGSPPEQADVVWLYGLGPAMPAFQAHAAALRLVGDKGYFSERGPKGYLRVSVNAQQPDLHLRNRRHDPQRWRSLGIDVDPVAKRGDYVLICGMGPKQATRQGLAYGEWERATFAQLRQFTSRPLLVREKPKNSPIPGLPRSSHGTTSEAIRGAWAVVCMTGNIGADAILEGVPVIAQAGPGSVYYDEGLHEIERIRPMPSGKRLSALSDIAAWNWSPEEIAAGQFWGHLKNEGMV